MDLEAHLRVHAKGFKLADFDPADTAGLDKAKSSDRRAKDLERLAALQERLYAESRQSLLIVIQAMDAAGKDGTISHVMTGVNPQGVRVTSFKQPSHIELDTTGCGVARRRCRRTARSGSSTARTTRRCS